MRSSTTIGAILAIFLASAAGRLVLIEEAIQDVKSEPYTITQDVLGSQLKLEATGDISFQCANLYQTQLSEIQAAKVNPPPAMIPTSSASPLTMGNVIPVFSDYRSDLVSDNVVSVSWTGEQIHQISRQYCTCGAFNNRVDCAYAMLHYRQFTTGKRGLAYDSELPWAEGSFIGLGAGHVVSVNTAHIDTSHAKHSSITHTELANQYLSGTFSEVDFAWSYNYIQSLGLGLHGEPINPTADLEEIARVHCLLKPGGLFFLGLPTAADAVGWNTGRVYGRKRLQLVLAGWDVLDVISNSPLALDAATHTVGTIPIWVLRKKGGVEPSADE